MLASDLPTWGVRVFAFAFGAAWGSFFNVAIHRWPREMSVVSPPSHCPHCGTPIQAWRNVPIFGFLFLRGRAACCGVALTPRYLLVEVLGALLCVVAAERWLIDVAPLRELTPALLEALAYFAFMGGLLVATFIDLEWMEIPDEVTLPGASLGLATAASIRLSPGADSAALGAGAGYLVIQVLFVWCYERVTGRRGMGEGDSKLLLFAGAFLGWEGALFTLVAGAFQGLIAAIGFLAAGRDPTPVRPDEAGTATEEGSAGDVAAHDMSGGIDERDASERDLGSRAGNVHEADTPEVPQSAMPTAMMSGSDPATVPGDGSDDLVLDGEAPRRAGLIKIPFGPFLALGALEYLFFGPQLVDWYLQLLD